MSGRPAILYISYDGMAEPLGRSQVLSYLLRLAGSHDIALVSFEKGRPEPTIEAALTAAGIRWIPLRYHRRPPVLSTAWDVWRGARAARREARRRPPAIVHVRSYVPALMALRSGVTARSPFLFDIRGFWANERVEAGLWRPGGPLYGLAKRCERRFFAAADGVVTLTRASVPQIREWAGDDVPVEVIPTCADPEPYAESRPRPEGPHAVWIGSLSTWYRFDLAVRLARALGLPFTVLTREPDAARSALGSTPADVRSVPADRVPDELHPGDLGLCLVQSSFSKTASAPTRFAEYLAAGMPVAVTAGVGDMEEIVERERVGVVLRGEDDRSIAAAGEGLMALSADPRAHARCRAVAAERFDVTAGARSYARLYERLKLARADAPVRDPVACPRSP